MSTARPLAGYDQLTAGAPGSVLEARRDKVLVLRVEQGVVLEFSSLLRYAGGVNMSSDGSVTLDRRQCHVLAKLLAAI